MRKKRLPLPGQRIFRSMVAIWLCFVIYLLRGRSGYVIYSCIAAIQCIQPYTKDMKPVVMKRVVGTVIGAAWGLLLLLLELELISQGVPDMELHYLLIGLLAGAVIYSTVLLGLAEMAYFSAVTFLCVTVTHVTDVNPYLYAFHRLLDTLIGVMVAEVVNRVQLPRRRDMDTLFVSTLSNSLLGENDTLTPYSRVELNRLIEDGIKFTISTAQSQARIRELLPGVNLRYPVITMDGAALYDMNAMEYLCTSPIRAESAEALMTWAHREGFPFFASSVKDNLLVIHYTELGNEAMEKLFAQKRRSPYRNFVRSPRDEYQEVLCVQLVLPAPEADRAEALFHAQPWSESLRAVKGPCEVEGYVSLKVYNAKASREAMLRVLEQRMGTRRTVTLGGVPGKYDVYIQDADRNILVRELRRRFEPVDIRGWRNIFRT